MLNLPAEFISKYQKLLGQKQAQELFDAMNQPAKKAFKINTLKGQREVSYSLDQPIPGLKNAYYGQINGQDPEAISGLVYSQDPAAMFPAMIADIHPGDIVLDLCAAPGGKSTFIADQLKGKGLLVANEISNTRVKALRENLERWGVINALITSASPEKLVRSFTHFFDKIIVDAPCSGEGMFRKNPEAVSYWSQDYVMACQKRQKEILTEAVKMLKPGGELIYSTCTFSPEEDEEIVSWLVEQLGFKILPIKVNTSAVEPGRPDWANNDPAIKETLRFWPNDNLGEGQYVAKLQLAEREKNTNTKVKKRKAHQNKAKLTSSESALVAEVFKPFNLPLELANWSTSCLVSQNHVYLPAIEADNMHFKIISNGLELGILKKKRFEPSHQLALVLGQRKQKQVVNLTKEDYAKYIHGETIRLESALHGFVLVSCQSCVFSFGKITNNVLKNFYPKGLRK